MKNMQLLERLCDSCPRKFSEETINHRNKITPSMTSVLALSLEADQSNITSTTVSNASKALEAAMLLRSRPDETEAATKNDFGPERSIRSDVVSLAEETELYSKDADPTQSLERLAEITPKHLSNGGLNAWSAAQYQLPAVDETGSKSFGTEILSHIFSQNNNASTRARISDRSELDEKDISSSSATGHSITPSNCSNCTPPNKSRDYSEDADQILQVDTGSTMPTLVQPEYEPFMKNSINIQGRSRISLQKDPKDFKDCSLNMEIFGTSVVLQILVADRSFSFSNPIMASEILSPIPNSPQSTSHFVRTDTPRILKHCFQKQARPIPHILYPDVEGPAEEPNAPYTITFKERQYISLSQGQCWTNSLTYISDNIQDRITLSEKIFGKTLLMSVGAERITVDNQEVSYMSAISLWLDNTSETRSITFFPSVTGKKAPQGGTDVELRVHGIYNAKTTSPNASPLTIVVGSMPGTGEGTETLEELERHSSAKSRTAFFGRASTAFSPKWKKCGRLKFIIEFTRPSERSMFLSHLV